MLSRALSFLAPVLWLSFAPMAQAVELVMVEREGCHYCIEWKAEIGPIYPKTAEGAYAPLRMVDIADAPPDGMEFTRKVLFTPTFVLVDDGQELARIEGYPGEDFFWGLLTKILENNTNFEDRAKTN
ncbi:thioredoxin family protein [Roseovarius sp. MMSF_3281]|uniref:thioredoxin family protein n=1 Tax=Roseovarius sp. MMSF_3281 TaxID=3046694 RepID=UPI00273FF6BC|nr:thioredoxin family protein [Roseovarius sp. MMSF_3281]